MIPALVRFALLAQALSARVLTWWFVMDGRRVRRVPGAGPAQLWTVNFPVLQEGR